MGHQILPLFLVLLLAGTSSTTTCYNLDNTDLNSLLAFKSELADPFGILTANWTTNTSVCNWFGVACGHRHLRVVTLDLTSIPLQGTISPHLANLSFLSDLSLANTSLTGTIPAALGYLPRLQLLDLSANSLSGPIPSTLFNMSSLVEMALVNNQLSGVLPSNHTSGANLLPRLQNVYLANNQLTGSISTVFTHCPDLRILSIVNNLLTGNIPAELGHLPLLKEIYLSNNMLTGELPPSLGNLSSLGALVLDTNNLEGKIPAELGNLQVLQILLLGKNRLIGEMPLTLLNISTITYFDLFGNSLTGTLPAAIGLSMPRLLEINFAVNSFTGGLDILASLSNCMGLNFVALADNQLDDVLPSSIGNLSAKMETLALGNNYLKGRIPPSIGNLSNLFRLHLSGNELSGTITPELGRLQGLQRLDLGGNKIGGSIPSELGNMPNLNVIEISGSELSGAIPDSVGNLTGLQTLWLDSNKLSSNIPSSLWSLKSLIMLDLSRNNLTGMIPPSIGNLKALDTLDLSHNQLSGNISSAFGALQMLNYLNLSKNSFHGQIPKSLGKLISIRELNLSHNFLTGAIPKALANLQFINSLDLSFNELEGEVPEGRVFSNLTVSSLQGNSALCGAPPLYFPPCPANAVNNVSSSRKLNPLTYILPIVAVTMIVACFLLILLTARQRRKTRKLAHADPPPLGEYTMISYHDLLRATSNFNQDNLLGRGNFGSVYKGSLDNGSTIAVKVLDMQNEGVTRSFDAECQALSRVRHRNLIGIISVCSNLDFKALILEFMPNGSLEEWLHSENYYLTLLQRLNIMVDTSLALEYLHHHHPQVILHCDLKPGNILLDEEMVAHVSDFGIAKVLHDGGSIASASTAGTFGYIAPEYGSTGNVSRMSDVYSFGILLLETFTSKKPTNVMFDGDLTLREHISRAFSAKLLDIVDVKLLKGDSLRASMPNDEATTYQCLSSIIELGLLCSSYPPDERIPMVEVVLRIRKIKEEYLSHLSSCF